MATTFDEVKTWIPSLGEYRAYIFTPYMLFNGQCTMAFTIPSADQCTYLAGKMSINSGYAGDSWGIGCAMEGIYPEVGDWVSIKQLSSPGIVLCFEVRDMVNEVDFNNGTCLTCPATSNCPGNILSPNNAVGCLYNNTINQYGIKVTYLGLPPISPNYNGPWDTLITASSILGSASGLALLGGNCVDCLNHVISTSIMNGVRSCCDHSIQYLVDQGGAMPIIYQVGEAFYGNFSILVNNVDIYLGFGCWEAIDNAVGPMLDVGSSGPPEPDCQSIVLPPGLPVCCPPKPDGCDSNIMAYLQDKVAYFKIIKDGILNP